MEEFKMRIVTIGGNKQPNMKWGKIGSRKLLSEEKHEEYDSFAYVPDKGFIVVDADDSDSKEKIDKLINKLGLKVHSYPTTRGAHYLFKLPEGEYFEKLGNSIGASVFKDSNGDSHIDLKGNDRGYLVLKVKGKYRDTIENVKEGFRNAPELPIMLATTKKERTIKVSEFKHGQRDDNLFNWIAILRGKKLTKQQWIKFVVELCVYTDYNGKNGSSVEEFEEWANVKWESSKSMGEVVDLNADKAIWWKQGFTAKNYKIDEQDVYQNDGIKDYRLIADHIIKELQIVISQSDRQIWGIQDGVFKHFSEFRDDIRRFLAKEVGNIKPSLFTSLNDYIKARAPMKKFSNNNFAITFANKTFDVSTMKEITLSEDTMNQNTIPHNLISLDEKGYEKEGKFLDKMFQGWSKKNKDIEKELYEMCGISMTKYTGNEQAYFLLGNGSNGKSWFLKMLKTMLGDENHSIEDLKTLSEDKFSTVELYSMLANINTDISGNVIQDPSLFKKITSGETISGEAKSKSKFRFSPYATLIFGANSIPYTSDGGNSDGSNRRLKIITFNANFKKDKNVIKNINLEKELYSERVIELLIVRSIKSLNNALNKGFTTSAVSEKAVAEHMKELNNVITFYEEYNFNNQQSALKVYNEYKKWTKKYNYGIVGYNNFLKKLESASRSKGEDMEVISHEGKDHSRHRIVFHQNGEYDE